MLDKIFVKLRSLDLSKSEWTKVPSIMILFQGDIEFELYWRHAPKTCRNFVELVSQIYMFSNVYVIYCVQ